MKWKNNIILFLMLLFYPFFSNANHHKIALLNTKVAVFTKKVIFYFTFDRSVKYHCLVLSNPSRFVIDFDNTALKTKFAISENEIIKKIRSSNHENKFMRIVIDLKQKITYKTLSKESNHQLLIELLDSSSEKKDQETAVKKPLLAEDEDTDPIEEIIKNTQDDTSPTKLSKNLALEPQPSQTNNKPKFKKIVVVIDPGHGGKDPGARGPHGTSEKEVVLKISKRLQSLLNDEPGFYAVLTRTTDYYIPLRKRLAIARKNHADIFIAIHADAYHYSHATGASVYALSQRGATSEAAKWLAEKENESELGGLGTELADKDAILRSVLIDLSQTHTIESSLQIGDEVLHHIGRFAKLHHPRVEQAAFVVLKSPDIPSILVETGFLSNPDEEDKLLNPSYQEQTAYAIKEGIKRYFSLNAPS